MPFPFGALGSVCGPDHEQPADAAGARRHGARVRARACLGQAEGARGVGPVRQQRQMRPLLRLGPDHLNDLADHIGDGDGYGRRGAGVGEFLHRQREGDRAGFGAAVIRRDVQRHEAVRSQRLEIVQKVRPPLAEVEARREGRKPIRRDASSRLADHLFLVGQREMHRSLRPSAIPPEPASAGKGSRPACPRWER